MSDPVQDPHAGQPILHDGAPLVQAAAAMILLHGRGASAEDILWLGREFAAPGLALLAPRAAGGTWYPNRFSAPSASNEPWLSSALAVVHALLDDITAAGVAVDRVFLLGFSQGGCLALEAAARRPQRYGGVVGLSAALIENGDQPRRYTGDLAGTPVFLGCSDVDAHIPPGRLDRSAEILAALGGAVDKRIYPGMGHTVNEDEIDAVRGIVQRVTRDS